jgi:hypothetical protein
MIKSLLLGTAFVTFAVAPAFACRGTAEYPEVAQLVADADIPAVEKAAYMKRLQEGEDLHQRGHDLDDAALRLEALKILDEIKGEITH